MSSRLDAFYRSTFGFALVGAVLLLAALPPLGVLSLSFAGAERMGLPPLGTSLLAWIAPVWWILLIRRRELAGRRPYRALWLVGVIFWLAALHWLRLPHWATGIGLVAMACYLGCYLPLFVGLSRVAVHRLRIPAMIAAPVVWTGLELARGHLLTGISMGALGHTQYKWIELIQVSDLAGAYAVDFVVMFAAACLAGTSPCEDRGRTLRPLVPLVAMLAAVLVYGRMRMLDEPPEPVCRVALIQGSIDIEFKSDPSRRQLIHDHYVKLTDEALSRYGTVDAIVWPETMFLDLLVDYDENPAVPLDWQGSKDEFRPALAEVDRRLRLKLAEMANRYGSSLVLGVDTQSFTAAGLKRFNSAAFVTRSGELRGRYDKMHRVLFGEYVPFADRFPWLQRLTPLPVSINAGDEPVAFDLDNVRIAPNICYESVLPHVIRRQVNVLARAGREPDVLVNLTNDGWFWGSSELDMHLVCGVFRAVECRKPFLIAANTGFSAWIDSDGRIVAQGPRRDADTLLATVGCDHRESWYLDHGDLPAGLCLAACLLLATVGSWGSWISRKSV